MAVPDSYWMAPAMLPPRQPALVAVAQSTSCCSETLFHEPELICHAPSVLPVVEGPARAALALVLDWCHCTLGGPVNGSRQLGTIMHVLTKVGQTLSALRGLVAKACGHTVLLLSEVRKLILAELEAQVQGVVICDALHVGLVCCPGSSLITIVHLVVLGLEGLEVSRSQGQGRGDNCCAHHG